MVGKILAPGVISGNDGNRYSYEVSELKNLENKDPNKLSGSEVDFTISGDKATDIFITTQTSALSTFGSQFTDGSVKSIKNKMLAGYGCAIFSFIPVLGFILGIASIVLIIWGTIETAKMAESKTLIKNIIISCVAMFFAVIGVLVGIMASSAILSVILALVFGVLSLRCLQKYHKELSLITEQKLFMTAFYCFIGSKSVTLCTVYCKFHCLTPLNQYIKHLSYHKNLE